MIHAQPGIFHDTSSFHYHLEFSFSESGNIAKQIADVRNLFVSKQEKTDQIVIGIRPSLWQKLSPHDSPHECIDFNHIEGINGTFAPATQNDLWIWLHGQSHDRNLNAALAMRKQLADVCELNLEIMSFVRHENRDLTGFIDGSANPKDEALIEAAVIPSELAGGGGSIALTQRWAHNLVAFDNLSIKQQEAVIGRTKIDSIELVGDAMPVDSHVSRTDVKIDNVALKIYRRSTPYGTVNEHGLFFVAFACEQRRLQIQLERMFGVSGDNIHDKLIEYSRPVSGSYWYVPAIEKLVNL